LEGVHEPPPPLARSSNKLSSTEIASAPNLIGEKKTSASSAINRTNCQSSSQIIRCRPTSSSATRSFGPRLWENARHVRRLALMSVSKPFVFALVCEIIGPQEARRETRRECDRACFQLACRDRACARRPYEPDGERRRNRGDQLGPGRTEAEKWKFIHDGLSRFAGRMLFLNEEATSRARL
jgi:hypothetical protein